MQRSNRWPLGFDWLCLANCRMPVHIRVFVCCCGWFFGWLHQVTTTKPTKVLTLDRSTFTRVMGPLTDVLKRNMDQYEQYMRMNM